MTAKERLEKVLQSLNVGAKRSLGQNFLVSDLVIEKIIAATDKFTFSQIIEIGPGPGALTDKLRQKTKNLMVIELDREFSEHWRQQGLEVVEADALQTDWSQWDLKNILLVSNLPYQISASIVIDRSIDSVQLVGMVLMFQKEVAQRIRAAAKTEHYGMLSVIAQNFWTIETVSDVGPKDFWPPPKVASRVLSFKAKPSAIVEKEKFLKFVKQGFSQRRKLLRKNLDSILNPEQKIIVEKYLTDVLKNQMARAEELSPEQWATLFGNIQN